MNINRYKLVVLSAILVLGLRLAVRGQDTTSLTEIRNKYFELEKAFITNNEEDYFNRLSHAATVLKSGDELKLIEKMLGAPTGYKSFDDWYVKSIDISERFEKANPTMSFTNMGLKYAIVSPCLPYPDGINLSFACNVKTKKIISVSDLPQELHFQENTKPSEVKLLLPRHDKTDADGNIQLEQEADCDFADLRWTLPSGTYPMTYEVDVSTYDVTGKLNTQMAYPTWVPYFALRLDNQGFRYQIKVRGVNKTGEGAWSKSVIFCRK